jgi:MFS family permease
MLSFQIFLQKKKYFASAFFYGCFSLLFSIWVIYIPYIADKIGITEGRIGGAIFFASLGSLIMIPICNRLVGRLGAGRMTFFSLCFYCVVSFGPFLATNYYFLCMALFFCGMAGCSMGITINSLTATIEKADKVFIMSGSHGFFSAGGMIGAFLGSIIAAKLNNPLLHLGIVCFILLAVQIYFIKEYFYIKGEQVQKQKRLVNNLGPLIVIAVIALIIMVTEGAIADWSALYLKKIVNIRIALFGFGYAGFSMAMTTGRFFGDWISKKLGSWQLISSGIFIALIGFALVLVPNGVTSLAGFTVIGLGFSTIVPEIYRIAANIEGVNTHDGVSFISASANIGFLVGPVFLGFLAEYRTLHFSFLILGLFVFVAFVVSVGKMRISKIHRI